MKKLILFTTLITAFAISASAQDVCPQGQVCFSQADADRISTGLAELKASRALVTALEGQVTLKDEVIKLKDDLIEQQKMTLRAQQETIVRLTNLKCSKGSFMILLYRWKRCS